MVVLSGLSVIIICLTLTGRRTRYTLKCCLEEQSKQTKQKSLGSMIEEILCLIFVFCVS